MVKLTSAEALLYNQGSSGLFQRILGFEGPLVVAGFLSIALGPVLAANLHADSALASLFIFTLFIPMLLHAWKSGESKAHEFTIGLRHLLEAQYGVGLEDGCSHVGISFESKGRFSVERFWDIGFLTIGDRLVYFGDNRMFDLSQNNIIRARVRSSFSDLGAPRLHIEYREAPRGEVKQLVIQARVGASRTKQYVELQRLRAQIAFMPEGVTGHLLGLPGKA